MNVVYGIKCSVNGKYYVGSSTNVKERMCRHKKDLRRGNHHSRKLQRAWDKYGENAFIFEKLEVNIPYEELVAKEQFWMDKLNSYHDGYNGYRKSTPCPSEFRNGMWGKCPANKGKPNPNRRPVVSYDLMTGEVVSFESVNSVSKLMNIGPQFLSCITLKKIHQKKSSVFVGKFWFYEQDFCLEELKLRFEFKNKPHGLCGYKRPLEECERISERQKGVRFSSERKKNQSLARQKLINGGYGVCPVMRNDGQVFSSIREAARAIGADSSGVSHVLSGKIKTCKGFSFKYANS